MASGIMKKNECSEQMLVKITQGLVFCMIMLTYIFFLITSKTRNTVGCSKQSQSTKR